MYILFIQVEVFSSHADHTGNQAIYNDKHHIKPDIHLQKAIQNIETEMYHDTVKQIVIALHKCIDHKAEGRHDDHIGQHIWDHVPA